MSLADKASLLLIPTGYKSQKVYSIFPTDGVGDFDFSRSSSATRIAKNGLITSVAANVPRLEYPLIDGVVSGCPSLLLEPARTNLITYSEDFSNAAWSPTPSLVTVTSNQFISPNGTQNADRLQIQSTASLALLAQLVPHTINIDITISAWVKSNTNSVEKIKLFGDYGTSNAVSSEFLVTDYWKRIEFSFTPTATGDRNVGFYNVSGTSTDIQIYGFQAEANSSYATSYIPTQGSTVTRVADTATGSGDATTFNDSEGVLMAEISALNESQAVTTLSISDNSLSNRVLIALTSGEIRGQFVSSGNDINRDSSGIIIENFNKIACRYTSNTFKVFVNGYQVGSTATITSPLSGITELSFDRGDGVLDFEGKTKQIQYYNSALTDSELEILTSWTSFSEMAQGQQYSIK